MTTKDGMIGEITDAQHKHLKWKSHLMSAIAHGQSDITPDKARCDKSCDFAQWFNGPSVDPALKESEAWRGIRDIHTSFHHGAAEVLALALGGRREDAKALLSGEFTDRADRMLKALSLWKLDMKTSSSGASDRAES